MALTYGFYNSFKGDRRYNAEQMSEIFDGILIDGIIPGIGQLFVVKTASNRMQITVGTGRAWFDHTWTKNDSVRLLTVPPCDVTRPRYDAVVLEVNHNDRMNSIKIVQGVPSVNPLKPTLVNEDKVRQYPLAYILVRAGTSEIMASDIENTVGRSPTPFATGVLETAPLDDLWNQWKGEFTEWFDNIKAQLSGNIATNLQNQIDQIRANIPVKATINEALLGSNDTKFVSPAGLKATIDANQKYLVDNNGTKYTWRARNVLPMLNDPGTTDISVTSLLYGIVIKLANYEVLHYENKIWVFDKAGSVRNYSVACSIAVEPGYPAGTVKRWGYEECIVTDRAIPIHNTNSYIAFTKTSLYKITVGTSTPTVELYYSWPATDGRPVALSYIDADWSALILGFDDHKFRVFKIPNKYVSQPTIYTFGPYTEFGVSSSNYIKFHGIAGQYGIYIAGNASVLTGYMIVNLLTGTVVKGCTTFTNSIEPTYCFVDDLHGIFAILGSEKILLFSGTSTSYNEYSLNPIPSANYVYVRCGQGPNDGIKVIDRSLGLLYLTALVTMNASDEKRSYYIFRYQYVGTFRASVYTYPPYISEDFPISSSKDLQIINGSSKFVTYLKYDSASSIYYPSFATYAIIPLDMSSSAIYLEINTAYSMYSSSEASNHGELLLIPSLMIYERFIYARPKCPPAGVGKYDMLARSFIGVPI